VWVALAIGLRTWFPLGWSLASAVSWSIVVDDEKLVQDVVDASSLLSENTFAD